MKPVIPKLKRGDRTRAVRAGAGGLVATLLAAEAAARADSAPAGDADAAPDDGPVATSLEDILGLAAICATRAAFAGFERHDHDYFRPRFLHRGHDRAEPGHDGHGAADGRPQLADAGHAEHAPRPSAYGTPMPAAAPAVASDAHDHGSGGATGEAPALDARELFAAHAHGSDVTIDEGLDALLAAVHGAHETAAEAPEIAPAASAAEHADSAAAQATPISIVASLMEHHHGAEAVIAVAEI